MDLYKSTYWEYWNSNPTLIKHYNFYFFFSGEDNATTCALLQDDLKEYSKIVDDQEPGSVNNYADYILSSIAQCQNGNCLLFLQG